MSDNSKDGVLLLFKFISSAMTGIHTFALCQVFIHWENWCHTHKMSSFTS